MRAQDAGALMVVSPPRDGKWRVVMRCRAKGINWRDRIAAPHAIDVAGLSVETGDHSPMDEMGRVDLQRLNIGEQMFRDVAAAPFHRVWTDIPVRLPD